MGNPKHPSSAPWEQSSPGRFRPEAPSKRRAGTKSTATPSPPVGGHSPTSRNRPPDRAHRPQHRQDEPSPVPHRGKLSMDSDAAPRSYTEADSQSFWSLPEVAPVAAPPISAETDAPELSGPAEEFDNATGWSFPAVPIPEDEELQPSLSLTDEERALPVLPSEAELFSGTGPELRPVSVPSAMVPGVTSPDGVAGGPSLPPPGPKRAQATVQARPSGPGSVEDLLSQGRELLAGGELAQALKLLRHAKRVAPNHRPISTWLDFAERRVLRDHLPNETPDSVTRLAQDRRRLFAHASDRERQLLGVIDGKRTLSVILNAGAADAVIPMLAMLSEFRSRGWITWA